MYRHRMSDTTSHLIQQLMLVAMTYNVRYTFGLVLHSCIDLIRH